MNDPSEHRFWLMNGDTPAGPYSVEQIHGKLAAGEITWQSPVCAVGESSWLPLVEQRNLGPRSDSISREVNPKTYDDPWQDRPIPNDDIPLSLSTQALKVLPRLFRTLIAVDIVVAFLSMGLGILGTLLQDNVDPQVNVAPSPAEGIACVTLVLFIPAMIGGWVGMLLLRDWGRWLFLAVICFGHFVSIGTSLFNFSAGWHLPSALDDIGSTISGILIGIAFFSPLAAEFRRNVPAEQKSIR